MRRLTFSLFLVLAACGSELEPQAEVARKEDGLGIASPWWLSCPSYATTTSSPTEDSFGTGCLTRRWATAGQVSTVVIADFPISDPEQCATAIGTFKRSGSATETVSASFRAGRCIAVSCAYAQSIAADGTLKATASPIVLSSSVRFSMRSLSGSGFYNFIAWDSACQHAHDSGSF